MQVGHAIGVAQHPGPADPHLRSSAPGWPSGRVSACCAGCRRPLDAGRVPGAELVDGFLILLAGALMLTPGFLTDILAILLLLPRSGPWCGGSFAGASPAGSRSSKRIWPWACASASPSGAGGRPASPSTCRTATASSTAASWPRPSPCRPSCRSSRCSSSGSPSSASSPPPRPRTWPWRSSTAWVSTPSSETADLITEAMRTAESSRKAASVVGLGRSAVDRARAWSTPSSTPGTPPGRCPAGACGTRRSGWPGSAGAGVVFVGSFVALGRRPSCCPGTWRRSGSWPVWPPVSGCGCGRPTRSPTARSAGGRCSPAAVRRGSRLRDPQGGGVASSSPGWWRPRRISTAPWGSSSPSSAWLLLFGRLVVYAAVVEVVAVGEAPRHGAAHHRGPGPARGRPRSAPPAPASSAPRPGRAHGPA